MQEMNFFILNEKFEKIAIMDDYESLIWTDRYSDAGDFEIYMSIFPNTLTEISLDCYLQSPESEYTMVIEEMEIDSEAESGDKLIIRGESMESILKRRIVWNQTVLKGNLQNQVEKLLNENIINPIKPERKIPNFVFQASEDERITSLEVDAQFTGDTVFDAIKSMCDDVNLGFKVILTDQNQLVFSLYFGTDRSYGQDSNPYVVFSKGYENIVSSDYIESRTEFKNIALVAGEGEGTSRKTNIAGDDTISGLNRRELFVDARDLSTNTDGGTVSPADYNAQLKQRGEEELAKNKIKKIFDGEIDSHGEYQYLRDFSIGDIIQFENEYGITATARITEFIYSISDSGIETYPTLEILNE